MLKTLFLGAFAAFVLMSAPASAAPVIGKTAPDFTATDTKDVEHTLSKLKGKIVVLEWTNPGCPFVKKHYDSKNMQGLQQAFTAKDVVWITINSGAEGKQGHLSKEEANKDVEDRGAKQTAYILDPTGKIGKLYDAKTTPHMFVIDKDGTLVYEGAIDDNDSANAADAAKAKNYVRNAVEELIAGKTVTDSQTKAYGCSVKY